MRRALELARRAAEAGEVPVGCVITDGDGNIIGEGRNRCEENSDATAHAEMEAIKAASSALGDWRLEGCTLYVTLEPCPMCTGAIISARIPTVVFGARDEQTGSCGSVIDLFSERYGHKAAVYPGVRADECASLLSDFFKNKRSRVMNDIENRLAECRKEIDAIDEEISALFARRLAVCDDIAEIKKAGALQVRNPGREEQVISKVLEKAGRDYADDTAALYSRIFEITRARQRSRGAGD